jgi:4-hydroxy-2-oxoheptanedioate aldolase
VSGSEGVVARSANHLRELWALGRPAFGVWSTLPDPTVAELIAAGPFDYLCVDLQHGEATFTELPRMLTAMRAAGRAPLIRVPWNDPVAIMRALDTGAAGVVVPMVDDAAQAAAAAAACRFPPTGTRSWGPMWGYVRPDGALPPAEQDAAVLCLVMVETAGAIEALDELVAVPGVDGFYIGPNDLALACGYGRGTYRDTPAVDELIQRVVDAGRAAGLAVGLHCSDTAMARDWAARGATMLTVGLDSGLLAGAMTGAWATVHGPATDDEATR